MKLFGLHGSIAGARALAGELGLDLAPHEEREFEDGEFKIRSLADVRRERAVIYQSCAGSADASANDKLMRALIFAGALKDAGAADVTLVAPYLAYARKDRRTKARDPVSTQYLAQMIESVGIDEVVVADVHNPAAFENAFRCRKQNVDTAPLFVGHFLPIAAAAARVAVVSPDAGGVKRARHFADLLAEATASPVDLAFVEKHRSEGRVTGELFAGEVRGATVIVVDDMICGGTTMRRAALQCLERGARIVHAAATHGVFTPETAAALEAGAVASIVVTDSVEDAAPRGSAFASRLTVLPCASAIAAALG